MTEIVFVLPPGLLLTDYAAPADAFRIAALLGADIRVRTVAPVAAGEVVGSTLGIGIAGAAPLPDALAPGSIVILCGSTRHAPGDAAARRMLLDWLRRLRGADVRLACICSGALYAAHAGWLSGRRCTTHHALLAELRAAAPDAHVQEDRVFVHDRGVYTSAGITTGIDLALHLLAGIAGPSLAARVAREMVVYLRRGPDEPALSPWLQGRNHVDARIHRLQDAIAEAPAEDWSLRRMAAREHMSVRSLTRHFRDATGMSVHDYLSGLRLAMANRLRDAGLRAATIAARVGVGSDRQLRRLRARADRR